MFCAKIGRLGHTLAFRLTLWYTLFFVFSAGIVFCLFYMLITAVNQQRTDDILLTQRNEFVAVYRSQGIGMLQRAASLQAQAAGEKKMFYRLFYASGVVFSSSNMTYWKSIGINHQAVETVLTENTPVYVTHRLLGSRIKARVLYARIGAAIILQMGYAMEDEARLLQVFKQLFLMTMSALLILAVAGGWFMARRALSGVAMVTRAAQQISEQDLDTRVPIGHRHNEIDRLAITFNQMLDRVQTLVNKISQMNDNIAHDLRSPITRIRGLAEVTLTSDATDDDYQQMAANTIEECDWLLDMINTMLTISRTEAGVNLFECKIVEIGQLSKDACEIFRPLAEDKGLTLECQINGVATVQGDHRMLQRMVANLVDNAIKYSRMGGNITVEVSRSHDNWILLTITDTGIGISSKDHLKIFDRFYRGDQSRTQGGAGLGLSLVQAVVHAHGGTVQVQSKLQKGSIFTITLPAVKEC